MKILKWSLSILLGLIIVVLMGVYGYLRSTLPDYDGKIIVPGLYDQVEIIRDSYGMPHIFARSNEDVSFALGYCMAQDRLFQMDLVRRAARGRLSEIMGEDFVAVDKFFRTITAGKSMQDIAAGYPIDIRTSLRSYAEGVNYYIKNHKGPLPIEFTILGYEPEPWQISDGAAVHYYMAWDMTSAFYVEILYAAVIDKVGEALAMDIFPDYPIGYPTIDLGQFALSDFLETLKLVREQLGTVGGGASNSWVVSGEHSVNGAPIFANDPHLSYGVPGIWYEAHLVTPSMNVSGAVLPGAPFVVIGANEYVAWGFTNATMDDADFYIEKINPANPTQYEFMGRWEDIAVETEIIKVKDAKEVKFEIKLTRHGPIIDDINRFNESKGESLAMRWTAYEMLRTNPFNYLNTARSIDDIEKAVEHFKCPGQNLVYADKKGNIGYWAAAGIPIRDGFSGAVPIPGWDGNHEWTGYVPTEELPHLRNPSRGWIATANNKHVGDNYPYPISHYYVMPDRFVRIQEMITQKDKLDLNDFKKMQADFYVVLARNWIPVILASLSPKELSLQEKKALSTLKKWDFTATAEGIAPTVFHATINQMVANTFRKRLGDELYQQYIKNISITFNALRNLIAQENSPWFDDPQTPGIETIRNVIRQSFKEAVLYLENRMGSDVEEWKWGKLHTLTFYHPFGRASRLMAFFMNIGPFPMGGSIATVNPQPYRLTNPWEGYHGASLRYIIDFSNLENSLRVIPTGISGNFMSPHYDDQTELWLNGKYRPFVLDRKSVENDAHYRLIMLPL